MSAPTLWYVHPYAGGPGVGRYHRPFALGRAWQAAGARVVVITAAFHHLLDVPNRLKGAHEMSGVPYAFLATPSYAGNGLARLVNMAAFSLQLLRHAAALARRYGTPDMIIGSSPHPYVFPAIHRLARRFGARSVFEVRDLWPLSLIELAGVSPKHPLVRLTDRLERYAYRRADAVVSLLPNTQTYMQARGLDPARWHYIPNGVDVTAALPPDCPSPACVQAQQWRAQGKCVIVYAGALGVPNHLSSLVNALAVLRARGDDRIVAVIVGRGEETQRLQALVHEAHLQDRVALYPQIPKEGVFTLLRHADAGYISLRPEPLFRFGVSPNKLFDYMLARLPVVFAIKAGNDPVRDHGCGYSVVPGNVPQIADALAALASLPATERQAMGERGFQYVQQEHGYPLLAARYLRILAARQQGQP